MPTNEKFFMVYTEDDLHPTSKHASMIDADVEAEKISRKTDKEVYILEAKRSVKSRFEFIKTDLQDPEDLPF